MGAVSFSVDPAAVDVLVESLGLEFFVETGTFHCNSIAAVADRFLRTVFWPFRLLHRSTDRERKEFNE